MSPFNKKLTPIDGRLAAYATLAGAALAAPAIPNADAAIIYSGVVNLNIPSTTAGLYLNVFSGVSNTNPALVPGWDVNPFSATALSFFNPAAPAGGVYVVNFPGRTSATAPDNLPFGTLISAASGFGSGAGETQELQLSLSTAPTTSSVSASRTLRSTGAQSRMAGYGFRFPAHQPPNRVRLSSMLTKTLLALELALVWCQSRALSHFWA